MSAPTPTPPTAPPAPRKPLPVLSRGGPEGAPAPKAPPRPLNEVGGGMQTYPTSVREIFPITGGQAGLTYALVLVERQHLYMGRGWQRVNPPKLIMVKGIPHEVLCAGEIIPGADPSSCKQPLQLDEESPKRTGLPLPVPKEK